MITWILRPYGDKVVCLEDHDKQCVLTTARQILKQHYVVFAEEIQTQNVNIYSINKVIIQTQKC